MACTRFSSDKCRIEKKLQQMTDPGRFVLNTPGNGATPYYVEDPHIRIQKWGGGQRTNGIGIENSLIGLNNPISRDCVNYKDVEVKGEKINLGT